MSDLIDEKPSYFYPKNYPGIVINTSYGHCRCLFCRDLLATRQQRDQVLKTLADNVSRMSRQEADTWLGEWAMRHGPVALQLLREHIRRPLE